MNKDEFIRKLQMVYVGDRNALNEMIGYYDGLKEVVEIVQQERDKYKSIVDKAIKYINDSVEVYAFENENLPHWEFKDSNVEALLDILKDNELEEGNSNE